MKKTFLCLVAMLFAFSVFAQEQATRMMRVFYDGNIIYQRNALLVDSINFFVDNGETGEEQTTNDSSQIYVGVVAFNQYVNQFPITNDLDAAKSFINAQVNDKNFTAFAYSVSKGNQMFDAADLPEFDKIFMLNFSDGTDNYSDRMWGEEGRMVGIAYVYDTAHYDLSQRMGLNSYAIGFGDDVGFGEKIGKVVFGSGEYYHASSSSQLQPTFNEIANSIIASSKNVVVETNPGFYNAELGFKYFRITFVAENGLRDTVYTQMEGNDNDGYTLSITETGEYAYFDAPASGALDAESGKVQIPLNNLKFIVNAEEVQFDFGIQVSFDGDLYYEDVEEASTAEAISKKIAVVMVLDCSSSMGESFAPMQSAAIDFIETLEAMDETQGGSGTGSGTVFEEYTETLEGGPSFTMKAVKGGTFVMGAQSAGSALPNYDPDANDDESPTHNVTLSDYYMGEFEVTQELWEYVMGAHNITHFPADAEKVYLYPAFNSNGNLVETGGSYLYGGSTPSNSYGKGDNYPVYYVSYNDIMGENGFLDRLNALTGKDYRLPTEAEWEYAARGGQENQYTRETTDATGAPSDAIQYVYSGSNDISDVAWYYYNSHDSSNPVGMKTPNELGIYDMSGNVWEWCYDWYGSYSSTQQTNPMGPSSGSYRVLRGGSWYAYASDCRVSDRYVSTPTNRYNGFGFRLVLSH